MDKADGFLIVSVVLIFSTLILPLVFRMLGGAL